MPIEYTEQFNRFWLMYPVNLAQGKPGSKFKAFQAWEKLSGEEQERVIFDTEALIRYDRGDSRPDRWPHASTYINQRYFERPIGSVTQQRQTVTETCSECDSLVIGPRYSTCEKHLETKQERLNHTQNLKDLGLLTPGLSLSELASRCRAYLLKDGNLDSAMNSLKSPES